MQSVKGKSIKAMFRASRTRSRTSASAARCDHVRGSRWRRPPSRPTVECYGIGSAVEIKLHEFAACVLETEPREAGSSV